MKCFSYLIFIAIFGGTWRLGRPTCVLESDFGFTINCAFKKSGLFRVRNLGGVKAHIGLGFTIGDELGFKESLSNVEVNKRRSAQTSKLDAQILQAHQKAKSANSIKVRSSSIPDNYSPSGSGVRDSSKDSQLSISIPPFRPIPPAPERPLPDSSNQQVPTPALIGIAGPPAISSKISSFSPDVTKEKMMSLVLPSNKNKLSSTDFALRTLPTPNNDLSQALPLTATNSIQNFLAANNVSEDALDAAFLKRQQMFRVKSKSTTTTLRPNFLKFSSSVGKVMNAPKEYYPVGYDKNFDDNFASRVELPETSFYCGNQKHFPGLYADEDLGCMVFHVCALTDEGLIMKSFLCPESTLFDQTILKCNWWFYVNCKESTKLYDSNIPISKSYQLMKALTFFSNYNKKDTSPTLKSNEKD